MTFQPPTHEVVTPIGKQKVVLKDFISGYDDEAIESIYTNRTYNVKSDPNNPDKAAEQEVAFDGSIIQQADREAIKRVVVSVDGNTGEGLEEGIVELIYSMRKEDTKFIKAEVNKVVNPEESKSTKKGSGN